MHRIGLLLATGREQSPQRLLDRARRAEAVGVEALWTYEDYAFADGFVTLGALAAVTHRVKLGLAVTNPFTRHPALLAMSGATLDRLSGGRAVVGIGRSLDLTMKSQFGIDYDDPYEVLEDTVRVVKRLWAGETVTNGRLHDVRLDNLPARPDIPLLVSGVGQRACALAGRCADGLITHVFASADLVRQNLAAFGRPEPECVALIPLVLTNEPDRYRPALRGRIAFMLSLPGNGDRLAAGAGVTDAELARVRAAFGTADMVARGLDPFTHTRTPERMAAGAKELSPGLEDRVCLLGDAATVRRRMAAYEAAGATSFIVEPFTDGVDVDATIERLPELIK